MATPGQLMFARGLSPVARLVIWVLIGVAMIVVDARFAALDFLRSGLSRLLQPMQIVMLTPFEAANEVGGFLQRHHELQQERDRLRDERDRLRRDLYAARDSQRENIELRGLLALAQRYGRDAITANVLYQGQDWFSRRITLDKGASSGVLGGSPVIDAQGLVGQVTRVYAGSSEVSLVNNSEQLTPVYIARTGLRALVAGGSDADRLEIRYIPVQADVKAGDILYTSGIDHVYPSGLPVARVVSVTRPQGVAYARVECEPLAGVARDRALLVLVSSRTATKAAR
jgi:rod shape-determining protein MreC